MHFSSTTRLPARLLSPSLVFSCCSVSSSYDMIRESHERVIITTAESFWFLAFSHVIRVKSSSSRRSSQAIITLVMGLMLGIHVHGERRVTANSESLNPLPLFRLSSCFIYASWHASCDLLYTFCNFILHCSLSQSIFHYCRN